MCTKYVNTLGVQLHTCIRLHTVCSVNMEKSPLLEQVYNSMCVEKQGFFRVNMENSPYLQFYNSAAGDFFQVGSSTKAIQKISISIFFELPWLRNLLEKSHQRRCCKIVSKGNFPYLRERNPVFLHTCCCKLVQVRGIFPY